MLTPSTDAAAILREKEFPPRSTKRDDVRFPDGSGPSREIGTWMRGLRSFFNLHNHPSPEAGLSNLVAHDWTSELRIVHETLLRCSQIVLQSIHSEKSEDTIFDEKETAVTLNPLSSSRPAEEVKRGVKDPSLLGLAAALGDACYLCQSLLQLRPVGLHAWARLGDGLNRDLSRFESASILAQLHSLQEAASIPPALLELTREVVKPPALGADMRLIFSGLFRLLEYLRYVELFLRQDQSLKQTLPIFTLVHEEARSLLEVIETRALRIDGLEKGTHEALDSMNYAIRMELRKVFSHELVEISSLQHAPLIYVKVENAHGLLRDSFQQSVVGLARLFNPSFEGAQFFDAFRTKLEESLALRTDLWTLLHLIRRCEKELDPDAITTLIESLASFREGSFRYLMFKDWESSERCIEEVDAARGNPELAAVLHRFAAYIEALSSQVNMRAVLVNHPFENPVPQGK